MILFTDEIVEQLLANGRARLAAGDDEDPPPLRPVVKFFTPDADATWLISEMDPDEPDLLFGLCDLGLGFPEIGYASRRELESVRGTLGLPVERDLCWEARVSLMEYAGAAMRAGRIVQVEGVSA